MKATIYTSSKQQSYFVGQFLCEINDASDEMHREYNALNDCLSWRTYRISISRLNKLRQKLRGSLRNEGVV
jgi:hypothetical protein